MGQDNFTGFYKSLNPLTACDQIMGVKGLSVPSQNTKKKYSSCKIKQHRILNLNSRDT